MNVRFNSIVIRLTNRTNIIASLSWRFVVEKCGTLLLIMIYCILDIQVVEYCSTSSSISVLSASVFESSDW